MSDRSLQAYGRTCPMTAARGNASGPHLPWEHMLRAGVSERVVMEISGHRTRAIFDRYDIVSETDLRASVEKTGIYVAGLPTTR